MDSWMGLALAVGAISAMDILKTLPSSPQPTKEGDKGITISSPTWHTWIQTSDHNL